MPKYLVREQTAMRILEASNAAFLSRSIAPTQSTTAQSHNANIIVSHITLVLQMRKPGVKTAMVAARAGFEQNLFAK